MTNEEKAREIANIYRDRMLQMNQICDNDWLIMELVNDVLEWKDEQFAQEKQQLIDEACEWLLLHDSYAKPTHLQVDRLREHLNKMKGE